jgi:putative SOS response-associated peptidase YedK
MCGRVRLSSDYSEIKIKLKFDAAAAAPNFEADFNIPPAALMLVAIRSQDGKRTPKIAHVGRCQSLAPVTQSCRLHWEVTS